MLNYIINALINLHEERNNYQAFDFDLVRHVNLHFANLIMFYDND